MRRTRTSPHSAARERPCYQPSQHPPLARTDHRRHASSRTLPLRPRVCRWRSLTYCIVDAVWSIGARYDETVVPLVRRVAQEHDPGGDPLTDARAPLPADPAPVPAFVSRFSQEARLVAVTNRQRTSTRNGALKATVALAHAEVFHEHGVRTLTDTQGLLRDRARFEHLDAELRRLPGEGGAGIRRGYLWMLVGDDDLVKPDRMVLSALRHYGSRRQPGKPACSCVLRPSSRRRAPVPSRPGSSTMRCGARAVAFRPLIVAGGG